MIVHTQNIYVTVIGRKLYERLLSSLASDVDEEGMMPETWIAGMHMNKGALHRALHVPEGKKIPKSKVRKAAHSKNPSLRRKAVLAETLGKMHHGS